MGGEAMQFMYELTWSQAAQKWCVECWKIGEDSIKCHYIGCREFRWWSSELKIVIEANHEGVITVTAMENKPAADDGIVFVGKP